MYSQLTELKHATFQGLRTQIRWYCKEETLAGKRDLLWRRIFCSVCCALAIARRSMGFPPLALKLHRHIGAQEACVAALVGFSSMDADGS